MTVDHKTTGRRSQIRNPTRENKKRYYTSDPFLAFLQEHQQKFSGCCKKKSFQALNWWIKSIIHHLCWAVSTCDGDKTMLREKWCSILFHIQKKDKWSSCSKFHKCAHPRITKSKAHKKLRLNSKSDAFKALQSIVLDKHVLGDLKYLAKISDTEILEIFHTLHNK